jgi:hypothetical protein
MWTPHYGNSRVKVQSEAELPVHGFLAHGFLAHGTLAHGFLAHGFLTPVPCASCAWVPRVC